MRRLMLVLGIFLFIFTLCIAELFYMKHKTEQFCSKVDTINSFVQSENMSKATLHSNELFDDWEHWSVVPHFFIQHSHIEEVTLSIIELEQALIAQDNFQYWSNSEKVKKNLRHIYQTEVPSLENIF